VRFLTTFLLVLKSLCKLYISPTTILCLSLLMNFSNFEPSLEILHMFQIRVVNAFRHGMDSQQLQQATSNPNIQRVLQKQASLSGKRFSVASSQLAASTNVQVTSEIGGQPSNLAANAAATNTRITIPEQSFSHTETAV
jgi:hypothetical protein